MIFDSSQEESVQWSVQAPWNSSISISKFREMLPRDVLYASEIGASFYDVYHAMIGTPPTNGATETARRRMEAGNFYEALVVWVFKRCGILKETQTRVRLNDPKYLPVHGKCDIYAGHDGDWRESKIELAELFRRLDGAYEVDRLLVEEILGESGIPFSDDAYKGFLAGIDYAKITGFDFPFLGIVKKMSFSIIDELEKKYPQGLPNKIYEVKSINSRAFWKGDEMIAIPYDHHQKQLTFYQLYFSEKGIEPGSFLYIDRDSMCISELPNMVKEDVKAEIFDWLEKMTYYYNNKIEPPTPEVIVYDIKERKYQFNWRINWSSYKDKIMAGVDLKDIMLKIKGMNKTLQMKALMKSAHLGETKHGNKKYARAIAMLKEGNSLEVVEKKTGVSRDAIDYYLSQLK